MKKIYSLILVSLTISLASCNIERFPSTSMVEQQIENDPEGNLGSLVNGVYAQLKTWSDPMHRLGEYAGDNMMIRGSSSDAFYEFLSYQRTPNNYRLQDFWDYGYKAIAQASNIIKLIKEGQNTDIDNYLGECYYVRGMMYFYLVRAFGRPYYQKATENLGVPIVNGTPDSITGDLHLSDRATVENTYQQAISDLKKAESLLTQDKGVSYASKGAAQAMLSRIYLYMSGTYEHPNANYAKLCIEYSDSVIDSGKYTLLSRDNYMKSNELDPDNNSEDIFVIRRKASEFSGDDYYYTIGGMYSNIGGMGWGEMYASAKYIDLLNETGRNDWRAGYKKIVDARANFIEPQYDPSNKEVFRFIKYDNPTILNYTQLTVHHLGNKVTCEEGSNESGDYQEYTLTPIDSSQGTYYIKYKDGKTYKGVLDYYIKLNRVYPMFYIVKCSREDGTESQLYSPIISRLDEIYLNRAEAEAKLGEYNLALKDLNIIRERSIINGGYSSIDASNAHILIDKERQLELAYEGERSYDVFRNGDTLSRHYPGPHNQFEDIPATDYRVTYYIPQDAINSYPGTLTQNPTENTDVKY